MIPGANLEAEVVPVSGSSSVDERSRLMLKCGATTSPLLSLPAPVPPGLKEVRVVGQYYEVKLPVTAPSPSLFDAPTTLMDATQLSSTSPTNFVCASCSLPLVHASRLREFRDLPSEHWAELVDAWMCHTDQRLHDHVKKHSAQGFWPQEGEALVGGSYILFEESAVVTGNFWPADEQDDRVRYRSLSASLSLLSLPPFHYQHVERRYVGCKEGRRWLLYQRLLVLSAGAHGSAAQSPRRFWADVTVLCLLAGRQQDISPLADTKRPRSMG